MLQLHYLKLGVNRGAPRLWLQGLHLATAGYAIGARYSVIVNRERRALVLLLAAHGERLVSRKKRGEQRYPVIDLNSMVLAELFSDALDVRVVVGTGRIEITLHPDEAARRERLQRLRAKLRSGVPLATGSISHGLGVMDHALHVGLADVNVASRLAWAIDCELAYLQASVERNPLWRENAAAAIHSRVEEVEPELLSSVDILVAGLPCTGASRAGKAKNRLSFAEEHETAATPFLAFLTILKACNPVVAILENVPDYQRTLSMRMLRTVLTDWGYRVHEEIVDRELGAFEDRKRLCVVAVTEGVTFEWNLLPSRQREACLGDILDDVPEDSPLWRECAYLDAKEARDIQAGKGFRTQVVGPDVASIGTIGRHYAKWRSTEPMVGHPTRKGWRRLLTPQEHARAKAVPESFIEGLSPTLAHQCLGQSVLHAPFVSVGRALGAHLLKFAKGEI